MNAMVSRFMSPEGLPGGHYIAQRELKLLVMTGSAARAAADNTGQPDDA
jgi:hypothetical protein